MASGRSAEIANTLRSRIADGFYPVGSKLPAITQLMIEFHVRSLSTIRQAQRILVEEGILRTEQGVGAWVIAERSETVQARQILDDLRSVQDVLARAIINLEQHHAGCAVSTQETPHVPPATLTFPGSIRRVGT